MGQLTLDRQRTTETCEHCRAPIAVSRGSVYDDGRAVGLYLAGMHRCSMQPVAILALALLPPDGGPPQAVHLRVLESAEATEMMFLDPADSPWREHHYLGQMLTAAEARRSPLRDQFIHVAVHAVGDLPELRSFLAGEE